MRSLFVLTVIFVILIVAYIGLRIYSGYLSAKHQSNPPTVITLQSTSSMETNNNISTDIKFNITSSAFKNEGYIPAEYTCDAKNINPPFHIENIPEGTRSLALIMDDPDAPNGMWVHWVKWNIPSSISDIKEDSEPQGVSGKGSGGNETYMGPCPPTGTHHYYFKLYALDTELKLPIGSTKEQLIKAMEGHIIGTAQMIGLYSRK